MENVEVLLVEDDPNDAELVLHVLKKNNMSNEVLVVQDGKEALDFLFCRDIERHLFDEGLFRADFYKNQERDKQTDDQAHHSPDPGRWPRGF